MSDEKRRLIERARNEEAQAITSAEALRYLRAEAAEAEAERLRGELAAVDAVLSRRPALDKPTRAENIEHACSTAGRKTDECHSLRQQLEAQRGLSREAADMLERIIGERDTARQQLEAAQAQLEALTTCECGRKLSTPRCGICDNDE